MSIEEKLWEWFKRMLNTPAIDNLSAFLTKPPIFAIVLFSIQMYISIHLQTTSVMTLIAMTVIPMLALFVAVKPDNDIHYPSDDPISTLLFRPYKKTGLFILLGLVLIIGAPLISYGQPFQFSHLSETMGTGALLYVLIIAPIFEELIFREILQRQVFAKLNWVSASIIIAFIFAFIHGPQSSAHVAQYMFNSLVYSYVYKMSGNDIRPVILLHMMNNHLAIM